MTPHITTQASTIRSGKHSTTLIISSMNRRNVRYQSLDRPVKRRRKVPESILKNTGYNSLPRGAGGPHELEQIDSLGCRVTLTGAGHQSRPPVEWQDNSFMYNAGP